MLMWILSTDRKCARPTVHQRLAATTALCSGRYAPLIDYLQCADGIQVIGEALTWLFKLPCSRHSGSGFINSLLLRIGECAAPELRRSIAVLSSSSDSAIATDKWHAPTEANR